MQESTAVPSSRPLEQSDILTGRGKGSYEHHGNVEIMKPRIQEFQIQHKAATRNVDKQSIATACLNAILSVGGRFVKKVVDGKDLVVEVSRDVAYKKVSHALRESPWVPKKLQTPPTKGKRAKAGKKKMASKRSARTVMGQVVSRASWGPPGVPKPWTTTTAQEKKVKKARRSKKTAPKQSTMVADIPARNDCIPMKKSRTATAEQPSSLSTDHIILSRNKAKYVPSVLEVTSSGSKNSIHERSNCTDAMPSPTPYQQLQCVSGGDVGEESMSLSSSFDDGYDVLLGVCELGKDADWEAQMEDLRFSFENGDKVPSPYYFQF